MSGMFGGTKEFTSISQPYLVNDFSDDLRVCYIKKSNLKPFNRFKVGKDFLDFQKYPKDVINGFEKVYRVFLSDKDKIKLLVLNEVEQNNLVIRHILRKTSLHSLIAQNMFQPVNWPLKRFKIKIRSFLKTLNKDLKKVIEYEIKELGDFNVPYFKSNLTEKSIFCGEKEIKSFFKQTSFERWEKKINLLSEKHLMKKKVELKKLLD